jgi:hypothetical protein
MGGLRGIYNKAFSSMISNLFKKSEILPDVETYN